MSPFATRIHPWGARLINIAVFIQLFLAGAHHAGFGPYWRSTFSSACP